ncbi:hypothetical protein ACFSTC_59680 [Nonomuraea ferruginea]
MRAGGGGPLRALPEPARRTVPRRVARVHRRGHDPAARPGPARPRCCGWPGWAGSAGWTAWRPAT